MCVCIFIKFIFHVQIYLYRNIGHDMCFVNKMSSKLNIVLFMKNTQEYFIYICIYMYIQMYVCVFYKKCISLKVKYWHLVYPYCLFHIKYTFVNIKYNICMYTIYYIYYIFPYIYNYYVSSLCTYV